MSDFAKHYVGLDLTGSDDAKPRAPISRVTLFVDEENVVTAGDDTGSELTGTCVHATQAMADAILAKVKGYVYHPFSSDDANIDPAAELGDGITAAGVYSVISHIDDDSSGYMSVSAPGEDKLEEDYGGSGYVTQQFNRKIAGVRSSITKTAEQILLQVAGTYSTKDELSSAEEELRGAISVSAQNITSEVSRTYSTKTELSEARAAAAADAAKKANAAQSAAASDATAKANKALSDAKADTAERLKSYSTTEEMNSAIEQTADSITSTVTKTLTESYATKEYADEKASDAQEAAAADATEKANAALKSAKEDTDAELLSYSTTTEMQSAITQSANSITSIVSQTYATKKEREDGDAESVKTAETTARATAQTAIEQNFEKISLSAVNESDVSFFDGTSWNFSGQPVADALHMSESNQADVVFLPVELMHFFEPPEEPGGGDDVKVTVSFDYKVDAAGSGHISLNKMYYGGRTEQGTILDLYGVSPTGGYVHFTTSLSIPRTTYEGLSIITLSGDGVSGPYCDFYIRNLSMIIRGGKSSITLTYNGVEVASADVTFSGMVTFEDLSSPGSTVVNGSNIQGGTITLGGAGNGNGVLSIRNANGQEIGRWDNSGITATNGTFSGSLSSATGSISSVTGSYCGSISSGGSFWGTLSSARGSVSSLGGSLSSALLNSCSLNGTSLSISGGSISNQYSGAALAGSSYATIRGGSSGYVGTTSSETTISPKLLVYGDISCNGDKSRVIETGNFGIRCLAAYETPLPTFSDYGVAALDDTGVCYIVIDPVFAETVDAAYLPAVFLARYGEGDVWVDAVAHDVVTVRGTPGLRFAWETRYAQTNTNVDRLRVMDFDYRDMSGEYDFDGEAAVAYEHSAENIDYAQAGYEYFIDFERNLTA